MNENTQTVDYGYATSGVTLTDFNGAGGATVSATDRDVLAGSIEVVIGSDFGDRVNTSNATVYGNGGGDTLTGTYNSLNVFYGGDGADTLRGGFASFGALYGDAGDDTVDSGEMVAGALFGGAGNDTLYGSFGDLALYGGTGDDVLLMFGDSNPELLYGGAGNDTIGNLGYGLTATLFGGAGDDTLQGQSGRADFAIYEDALGPVTLDFSAGTVAAADGTDRLIDLYHVLLSSHDDLILGLGGYADGGAGTDTLSFANALGPVTASLTSTVNVEMIVGSAFADFLSGDAGDNGMWGGVGNDTLRGNFGNDTLTGDGGGDVFDYSLSYGSDGTDTIADFETGDIVRLASGLSLAAFDGTSVAVFDDGLYFTTLVASNGHVWVAEDFETPVGQTLAGTAGPDNISSDDGGDTLLGFAGDDFLFGGSGNDRLEGGDGNDFLDGGYSDDRIVDDAGHNFAFGSYGDDYIGGSGLLSATGSSTFYGDDGNDTLMGGGAVDWLYGGSGNDILQAGANSTLFGGAGDDVFNAYGANDTVSYANDNGSVTVDLSAQTASSAEGNDLLYGVANVAGSMFDDTLTGDSGDNVLIGGGGADTFVYNGGTGGGTDTIADFDSAEGDLVLAGANTVVSGLGTSTVLLDDGTVLIAGNGHLWDTLDFA